MFIMHKRSIFLATSFSGQVDYDTGIVLPEYRKTVEDVISSIRRVSRFSVYAAIEEENWVISQEPPEVGVARDLEKIDESENLLALMPKDLVSAGLQFEIGYVSSRPFVATEVGTELGYFNQGLANLGKIIHLEYQDPEHLAQQLTERIPAQY
jgi:hypothetical protein